MSGYTLAAGMTDDIAGWKNALIKTNSNKEYKEFLDITSTSELVIVPNQPNSTKNNERAQCHLNCSMAEANGLGKQVFGWYVMNDYIYDEMLVGMCRLVHHSNLLLPDGTYVNITNTSSESHQLFLRDDARKFDEINKTGYNDRMVFSSAFMKGREHIRAVPRNKILFACNEHYDRDKFFEKFKVYQTKSELTAAIPSTLHGEERDKWICLKTNATVD